MYGIAKAKDVSRRPVSAEALDRKLLSLLGSLLDDVALRYVFLLLTVFPYRCLSTIA